jgi:hypothetical protein
MEVCEKAGVAATFMINVGEIDFWPAEKPNAESVIRNMVERGHDCQPHLHPAWAYWWCSDGEPGYEPEKDPMDEGLRAYPVGRADEPWTQRFFIRQSIDRLQAITGNPCICFRDNNYDVNDSRVFYALWKEGILSDWSMQKGCHSMVSGTYYGEQNRNDPLPDNLFWPDLLEPRRAAQVVAWPVLEIPNTVLPGTLQRFDFQLPLEELINGFAEWFMKVKDSPVAVCSLLNHQKREVFCADQLLRPWKPAGKKVLETMTAFFEHLNEEYVNRGKPVVFSTASAATRDAYEKLKLPDVPEFFQERKD